MMPRLRNGRLTTVLVGFVVGIALSSSLFGCVSENSSLDRFVAAIDGSSKTLSPKANRELSRFAVVYRDFSSDPYNTRELKQFKDAFARVQSDYFHPVSDKALVDAAIKGVEDLKAEPRSVPADKVVKAGLDAMVASLDPHSAYLDPEQLKEFFISTRGKFGGLGIEVTMDKGYVKVVSPIDGTPAQKAGLRAGDLITHLDGAPIHGISIMDAVKRMRGDPGSDIRLTIKRDEMAPFDVTLTRAIITTHAVRWRVEGDIGYVRVAGFTEQMEDGLHEAMEAIHMKLGRRLRGVVLDLRNNPGGLLDEALALADTFLNKGIIVQVRGRDPSSEQIFTARPGDAANGLPMVVLINGGSASASEIVASALQEDGRATIMGTRSFGKGSVQTIMPLPIKGALKLTTALYYGPDGRTIQARGVVPDITLSGPDQKPMERESDLPGAVAASSKATRASLGTVAEASCPQPPDGKDDRVLGCALSFLKAGSAERFLTAMTTGTRL